VLEALAAVPVAARCGREDRRREEGDEEEADDAGRDEEEAAAKLRAGVE